VKGTTSNELETQPEFNCSSGEAFASPKEQLNSVTISTQLVNPFFRLWYPTDTKAQPNRYSLQILLVVSDLIGYNNMDIDCFRPQG